jgi:hypothetical protein
MFLLAVQEVPAALKKMGLLQVDRVPVPVSLDGVGMRMARIVVACATVVGPLGTAESAANTPSMQIQQ